MEFSLKAVEGGDEPMVQQQDVPLSQLQDVIDANDVPKPLALPAPKKPQEDDTPLVDTQTQGKMLAAEILMMESQLVH